MKSYKQPQDVQIYSSMQAQSKSNKMCYTVVNPVTLRKLVTLKQGSRPGHQQNNLDS